MSKEQAHFNMVEQQIRPSGVLNSKILETLKILKREIFVPQKMKKLAFSDLAIPLQNGQYMLPPRIDAYILQEINPKSNETALEIGTGSGYMAALLANLSKNVDTIELDPDLFLFSKKNISKANIKNIRTIFGDGLDVKLYKSHYDVIVFSGALKKKPEFALQYLKIGGRLTAFVGASPIIQAKLITRMSIDKYECVNMFETTVPYFVEKTKENLFQF